MAPPVEIDANVKFLLTIMEHTELPKPDYAGVAEAVGINNAMNAQVAPRHEVPKLMLASQRRFKALVEKAGFRLVNDQVVPADSSTVTPKKARAKKTATPARKKRKMDDAEGEGGGEVGGTDEVGSAGGAAEV